MRLSTALFAMTLGLGGVAAAQPAPPTADAERDRGAARADAADTADAADASGTSGAARRRSSRDGG